MLNRKTMKCSECKSRHDKRDMRYEQGVVVCYDCYYTPIRAELTLLDVELMHKSEQELLMAESKKELINLLVMITLTATLLATAIALAILAI